MFQPFGKAVTAAEPLRFIPAITSLALVASAFQEDVMIKLVYLSKRETRISLNEFGVPLSKRVEVPGSVFLN